MSYNDISDYQSLIFDIVSFIEEQKDKKLKVNFFKDNYFCLWGITQNQVWVSDTYKVNRYGIGDLIQEIESRFNLDLQDFTGIVDRTTNLSHDFELEA